MKSFFQITGHFLIAFVVTYVLASLFHSQFILHELVKLNIDISLATRLSTTWQDLLGFASGYAPIIAVGLLIGLGVMSMVKRFAPIPALWLYTIGGIITMVVIHLAMHPIFEVTLIAGARTTLGMICQCFAGACGGYTFAHLREKSPN